MRFNITTDPIYGYKVSIPNYNGGEVVEASDFDALTHVAKHTIDALVARNHELKQKLAKAKTELYRETAVQRIRAEKAEDRVAGLEKALGQWVKWFYQLKEKYDAERQRKFKESYQPEYTYRAGSRQTGEAGDCNRVQPSREVQKETRQTEVSSNRPFTATANPTNATRFVWNPATMSYVVGYDPKPFDYQANGGQDANIAKSQQSFAGILSTPRAREVFDKKYSYTVQKQNPENFPHDSQEAHN